MCTHSLVSVLTTLVFLTRKLSRKRLSHLTTVKAGDAPEALHNSQEPCTHPPEAGRSPLVPEQRPPWGEVWSDFWGPSTLRSQLRPWKPLTTGRSCMGPWVLPGQRESWLLQRKLGTRRGQERAVRHSRQNLPLEALTRFQTPILSSRVRASFPVCLPPP